MNLIEQIESEGHSIILFDGVCNFCNWSIDFIIHRDRKNRFKFAALQSDAGKRLVKKYKLDALNLRTIILIDNKKYYTKTTAALIIAKYLGGFWKLLYIFIIIPPYIRNIFYSILVNYRYKWFGKRENCRVPSDKEKDKFLQ